MCETASIVALASEKSNHGKLVFKGTLKQDFNGKHMYLCKSAAIFY